MPKSIVGNEIGREFSKRSEYRSFLEIGETWLFLSALISIDLQLANPFFYCLALPLIASRQYALMILMHDAFHSLLHSNRKLNHFLGSVLLAYPCGSTYWIARTSHLAHHRLLGENEDPDRDLYLTKGKESLTSLFFFFLKLPLGEQIKRSYGLTPTSKIQIRTPSKSPYQKLRKIMYLAPVCLFQLIIISIFYYIGSPISYFSLWLLPLLLAIIFNGIRIFGEHGNISDYPGKKMDRMVSQISNPFERFFIAPFHMNYHAEHHLFPYVPHYKLPFLREKIRKSPKLNEIIQWRKGYFSFLMFFLRAVPSTGKVITNEE